MKYPFFAMAIILFSCSSRNDLTARLLNDKKVTEDSIDLAHNYESYYKQEAKKAMTDPGDSLRWKPLADSSSYFYMKGFTLKARLKAIESSLDSLSKMK